MKAKVNVVIVLTILIVGTFAMNPGTIGATPTQSMLVTGANKIMAPSMSASVGTVRALGSSVEYLQLPSSYNSTIENMNIDKLIIRGNSHVYIEASTINELYLFDTAQVYIKGGTVNYVYAYDYVRVYFDDVTVSYFKADSNSPPTETHIRGIYALFNYSRVTSIYLRSDQGTSKVGVESSSVDYIYLYGYAEFYINDSTVSYLNTNARGTVARSQIGDFLNFYTYSNINGTLLLPDVITFYNSTINGYYGIIEYKGPGAFANGTMLEGTMNYYGTIMDNYTKSHIGMVKPNYLLFTGHWNIVNTTFGNSSIYLDNVVFLNSDGYLKDVLFVTALSSPNSRFAIFLNSSYTLSGYVNITTAGTWSPYIVFDGGTSALDNFITSNNILMFNGNLTINNTYLNRLVSIYGGTLTVYNSELTGIYGYELIYRPIAIEFHFDNLSIGYIYMLLAGEFSSLSTIKNTNISNLYMPLNISNENGVTLDKQFILDKINSSLSSFVNVTIGSIYLNLWAYNVSGVMLGDFFLTGLTLEDSNVTLENMNLGYLYEDYNIINSTMVFKNVSITDYDNKMYFYDSNVSIINSTLQMNYLLGTNFYNSNIKINSSKLGSVNVISSTLTVWNSTLGITHIIDSIAMINDSVFYVSASLTYYYQMLIIDRSHVELNNVNITGTLLVWYSTPNHLIEGGIPEGMSPAFNKVDFNSTGVVFNKVNITNGYYLEGLFVYGSSTFNATSLIGEVHNATLSASGFAYANKGYAIISLSGGNITVIGPLKYVVWGLCGYSNGSITISNTGVTINYVRLYDTAYLNVSTAVISDLSMYGNSTFIGTNVELTAISFGSKLYDYASFTLRGSNSSVRSLSVYDYSNVKIVDATIYSLSAMDYSQVNITGATLYYGLSVMGNATLNLVNSSFDLSAPSPYPIVSIYYFDGKAYIENMNLSTPFTLYYSISSAQLGYGSGELTVINSNITTLNARVAGKLTVINSTIGTATFNIEKETLKSFYSLSLPADQAYDNVTWLSNNRLRFVNTTISTLSSDYYFFTSDGLINSTVISDNGTTPMGVYYENTNISTVSNGPVLVVPLNVPFYANSTSASIVFLVQSSIPKPTVNVLTSNLTFEKGLTKTIEWEVSTPAPYAYSVKVNGSSVERARLDERNTIISYDISWLDPGVYTILLSLEDGYGQTDEAGISVEILPSLPPKFLTQPNNATIPLGENISLTWVAEDASPATYTLFVNGSVVASGSWSNSTNITYTLVPNSPGVFKVELHVKDQVGLTSISTVYVTVYKPTVTITSSSNNITTEEGYPTYIEWELESTSDGTYTILVNGTIEKTGSFTNGDTVTFNLTTMTAGYYNITLLAETKDGASATNTVYVTITPKQPPVITYLNQSDFYNISTNETITLQWKARDTLPNTYTIYVNGTVNETGTWVNDEIISFTFGGTNGTYNITIVFTDKLNQKSSYTVTVNIYTVQGETPGEETPGEETTQTTASPLPIIIGVSLIIALAVIVGILYSKGYIKRR